MTFVTIARSGGDDRYPDTKNVRHGGLGSGARASRCGLRGNLVEHRACRTRVVRQPAGKRVGICR